MAVHPKTIYPLLEPTETVDGERTGRVDYDTLVKLVNHHTMRRLFVSTGHFGLLQIGASRALRSLTNQSRMELIPWHEERTGGKVEASVTMRRLTDDKNLKHEAWQMYIHTIGVWKDDRVYPLPY